MMHESHDCEPRHSLFSDVAVPISDASAGVRSYSCMLLFFLGYVLPQFYPDAKVTFAKTAFKLTA